MDMWMLVIGNALIFGAGVGVGILEAEKRIQKQTPTYTNYKNSTLRNNIKGDQHINLDN